MSKNILIVETLIPPSVMERAGGLIAVGVKIASLLIIIGAITLFGFFTSQVVGKRILDFVEKYGKDADTFGGHGYDAFMILVQAIREAGTEKAAIRNAIEHMRYTGISGVFKFSPKDHNGLTCDSFAIITIKNGEWVPVEKAAPESE